MAERVYEATLYEYPHAAVGMDERIKRAVAAAERAGATVVEREYSAAENAWLVRGWKSSAKAIEGAHGVNWTAEKSIIERPDDSSAWGASSCGWVGKSRSDLAEREQPAEPFANPWEPRNG